MHSGTCMRFSNDGKGLLKHNLSLVTEYECKHEKESYENHFASYSK